MNVTDRSVIGELKGPFGIGAAPVPPKGVGIMVGTDLAGGNDRCSLTVVVEGTVTVFAAMVTIISGTVTVNVGLGRVEGREPADSNRTLDWRYDIAVEDDRFVLDDEGELVENGGCWVRSGGWTAGLDANDAKGNGITLELDEPSTGTAPLMLNVPVEVSLVMVRVIVMQMVVVVLQAVTVVVQGVKKTLSRSVALTTSSSC